uniref:Uncharacterized protein n=1 Tax=Anguilla anguilla TaxID=7936 RepID=A0A0E9PKV1_ANGAN
MLKIASKPTCSKSSKRQGPICSNLKPLDCHYVLSNTNEVNCASVYE